MTLLLFIHFFRLFFTQPPESKPVLDICQLYGSIYVETVNRNRAEFSIFINKENSFPDLKVYLQENQLYADKPGYWYFVKDIELADHVIFIEKDKGRARYSVYYTDRESDAGCN